MFILIARPLTSQGTEKGQEVDYFQMELGGLEGDEEWCGETGSEPPGQREGVTVHVLKYVTCNS